MWGRQQVAEVDTMREVVSRLPQLRVLKLCAVVDDVLMAVSRCKGLEVFWARYGDLVTDGGIIALAKVRGQKNRGWGRLGVSVSSSCICIPWKATTLSALVFGTRLYGDLVTDGGTIALARVTE